ncbi:hypothetical protein ACEQ8H_000869 [Pleosporales sp. CAS-2024a]
MKMEKSPWTEPPTSPPIPPIRSMKPQSPRTGRTRPTSASLKKAESTDDTPPVTTRSGRVVVPTKKARGLQAELESFSQHLELAEFTPSYYSFTLASDNQSALALIRVHRINARSKHIAIHFHFVQELRYLSRDYNIEHIPYLHQGPFVANVDNYDGTTIAATLTEPNGNQLALGEC